MSATKSYITLSKNTIKFMANYVAEYEQVKRKERPEYRYVREFFAAKNICFQNFYKFYGRYIGSGRSPEAFLPTKPGPKPKYQETPGHDEAVLVEKIVEFRQKGLNKFMIAECLKLCPEVKKTCSASTVYRIMRQKGLSKLTPTIKMEYRKITREYAGSLMHVDCHYLPKGVIRSEPEQRYYVIAAVDTYSRLAWAEIINSTKAVDASFGMMDIIMIMNQRYGLKCEEILTDNGSEFCGSKDSHLFERLLTHFAIKH